VGPAPGIAALVERVRALLAEVADVEEKKMFGSTAFLVRGKMCVTARAERIMCRIAPELHTAAIKRTGCRAVVMRGRQYPGYVHVAAEVLGTERALRDWIRLALEHNEAQAAGRTPAPRPRRKIRIAQLERSPGRERANPC